MSAISLPKEFQDSLRKFESYPENLPPNSTSLYLSTRKAYRSRIDDNETDLFVHNERQIEVPYREFLTASGKEMDKLNIHTEVKLYEWLGIEQTTDQAHVLTAKGRDPRCRFIYIHGPNSRSELNITKRMLSLVLTYHQVMPTYLDFIFVFGAQRAPRDMRFSGFREQITLQPSPDLAINELGRSGCQYQLCYNLKGVTLKSTDRDNAKLNEWSIRQAAIHHQFDLVHGTTLWIVTKGGTDLQQKYKDLTGKDGRAEDKDFSSLQSCFAASLATQLLFCHWATEGWRWYLRWLEQVSEEDTQISVVGPRDPGTAHKQYKASDVQDLQYWQDKTNEAVMILEANCEILLSLNGFYSRLCELKEFPQDLKDESKHKLSSFASQLRNMMHEFKMHIYRAKLLGNILSDRKLLMSQHLQGQALERAEEMTHNMEREAVLMRIVTIVTLIYLPATFVSTFFSTDIVKYQNQNTSGLGNGTFSDTALMRWLQVTVPLTVLTLIVSWATYKISEAVRKQRNLNMRSSIGKWNRPTALSQAHEKYFTLPLHHMPMSNTLSEKV